MTKTSGAQNNIMLTFLKRKNLFRLDLSLLIQDFTKWACDFIVYL